MNNTVKTLLLGSNVKYKWSFDGQLSGDKATAGTFELVRQSAAYGSNGTLANANTPVHEDV